MGLAVAVGGVVVQVVAVVAVLGWQQEQVADIKVMGSVWSQFQWQQGLACLEGGVGASKWGCLCVHGGDGKVVAAIVLQWFELKI